MSAFDLTVGICKVIATSVAEKTGAILMNLVAPGGEDEESGETATSQPEFGSLGIIARPPPPSKVEGRDAYTEAVAVRSGDALIPIAYRDLRLNALYPSPAEGTIAFVGYSGSFVRQGMDGRVATYTTEDNTPTGRPVFYSVQPNGFLWEAPFGRMRLDATGFHAKEHRGARIDIGSISMPEPLASMSSYVTLTAATVNLFGSLVSLGPSLVDGVPVVKDSVALSTPLVTFAAALMAVVNPLVAEVIALAALLPDVTFPTTIAPLLVALQTAAAAVPTSVPSKSTSSA